MQLPATDDTIVAISSGWQATPLGIVRLSGPASWGFIERLGVAIPPTCDPPLWTTGRIHFDADDWLPATVSWFRGPRSYTGQDIAEIHTVGCLPLLRQLSAQLIEWGARRALPGEFTARAFMSGRLATTQVQGVLTLMQSEHQAAIRQAARLVRGNQRRQIADVAERITRLLAQIEAGIDFVDEEDIRFVTSDEIIAALDAVLADLGGIGPGAVREPRLGRPHIAFAGLPNAGKSTLFNALVGHERALVSPVLGTTRDVLAAEITLGDVPAVLQDCAGLGASADELELASHLAAEHTMHLADLVLWVHAADTAWDDRETAACSEIDIGRRVLVLSKVDLAGGRVPSEVPLPFHARAEVCATDGGGMGRLREILTRRLGEQDGLRTDTWSGGEFRVAAAALRRASELAERAPQHSSSQELISLELREALGVLSDEASEKLDEQLLDRIFAEFCVGK